MRVLITTAPALGATSLAAEVTPRSGAGPYWLWTADAAGVPLHRPKDGSHPAQDPSTEECRTVVFSVNPRGRTPTLRDREVCHCVDRALYALSHLYQPSDPAAVARFRPLFTRVFEAGRLALEEDALDGESAIQALNEIEYDLLADEWTQTSDAIRHTHDVVGGGIVRQTGEATGPYLLWTTDEDGRALDKPVNGSHPPQDRNDKRARDILVSGNPAGPAVTPADMEVYDRTDRLLHALRHLYPVGNASAESQFRWFYVRAFGIARASLETQLFTHDVAIRELAILEKDLIEDEGPGIKRRHVREHLLAAFTLSAPALLAYVTLRQATARGVVDTWLMNFGSNRLIVASFMLMLLGCFLGVCISYAWRKPQFAVVDDLVRPESDLLSPFMRLGLAGAISTVLVLLAMTGVANVEFGDVSLADFNAPNRNPSLPFVAGVLFGVFEKFLPETLRSKAPSILKTDQGRS